MVYIHVKKVGDKRYYSLRESIRKGNKIITKDICNLGKDLIKINIEDLIKKYKIKNSQKTIQKILNMNSYIENAQKQEIKKDSYFDGKQLIQINAILIHFIKKFKKSDNSVKKEILEKVNIEFEVENSLIKEYQIKFKEVEKLLKEDILPRNRSLREVYNIINTKKILDFLEENKPRINLELIEKIHNMLIENSYKTKGYRDYPVKIFGRAFRPTSAKTIKGDLIDLLNWFSKEKNRLHPLVLITIFHHKFEKIHPFTEGDGEIGRILINYMLSSFNYPPLIIRKKFKKEYLDSLKKADKNLTKNLMSINIKNYKPLIDFMQKQFVKTYWENFIV
jgi:fido (protein-threonine AMPylation protein)